jgi:MoaA/NifB/PqqE/SkfB family radical SAM enzyme
MITNELTIFCLTTGKNPNLNACLESLKNQTLIVPVEMIRNIYPISKAFQTMFDQCKTKYLIQVDEDFILYPHAIETLYNSIKNAPLDVFMSCYEVHDTHLDFDMYGIKIFNNDICKNYRLPHGTYSGSLVQIAKIEQAGYKYISKNQVLGLHSPKWTNELIFRRYFDLMDKYKTRGYTWMGELPQKLYQIFLNNPTDLNLYALMGSWLNMLLNNKSPIEKDDLYINPYYVQFNELLKSSNPQILTQTTTPPISATLSMTTKCQAKCPFCLRQSKTIEQAQDMTVDKVKELLSKFRSITSLCICGFGNPTDCDNFDEIVQYLYNNKIGMGLIVNGIGLKRKIDLLSQYKPNYISISLNAPTQELHEKITNTKNQFDDILESIQLCIKNKITAYLTYVCDTNNLQYIPDFLKLAIKLKVNGVHLFNLLPHHLTTNQTQEEFLKLVLTDKNQKDIDKLKKLPESDIVKSWPVLINLNEPKRYCKFAWQKLTMNGFGSISICNSVFPPEAKNGNIKDNDVWNNKYCQTFRNNFLKELPLACKMCWRNWERD